MDQQLQPLILCMENMNGEEVTLSIEPNDNFQTFLDKAKSLLGFDVDLSSITGDHPVSLNENIYHYLLNLELNFQNEPDLFAHDYDQKLERNANGGDGFMYVLDDGTQIRASQIHFDNEDPPLDLTAEKIPFVKYSNDTDENEDYDLNIENTKKINIIESPVTRWSSRNSSPKCSFVNSLPFRLVCSNTSNFEAQFSKYLESSSSKTYATLNPVANSNRSPRSLIKDNYKNYDENFQTQCRKDDFTNFTREEILNMFKDSPVTSLPYEENQNNSEKRRHVRKTDPSRLHKNWHNKPLPYIDIKTEEKNEQNCFICGKIDNTVEKSYLFDNEDQKLHRCSSPKKYPTQLKIICDQCLATYFKPCDMKSPTQSLRSNEFLVIKNNQQYIFQKVNDFQVIQDLVTIDVESPKDPQENDKLEFVKVEIGSDGEIVTKCIDNDTRSSDDVNIIKDEKKDGSSDVEIIEPDEDIDDNIIDNLEEADEDVKEFLGIYQFNNNDKLKELKCRFCDCIFEEIDKVIEHGEEHKHNLDDGEVFPCPLCDYGYANFKWLKGHLKAVHYKVKASGNNDDNGQADNPEKSPKSSPVAKRTRSAIKKVETDNEKEIPDKTAECTNNFITKLESNDSTLTVKTEVKQECLDSSDDEAIWILQTVDHETSGPLENLLKAATMKNEDQKGTLKKKHKCNNCSRIFSTSECLTSHKCRRRGRKRKDTTKDDSGIRVPSEEDFYRRAQGRPRQKQQAIDNDLLVVRPRKKRNRGPTSDPQFVTCHNCNESFTSKVRLKFHMQFHDTTKLLTSDGQYVCPECEGAHFPTESELFDHVHFQHHKQNRWQCPVKNCGKTFFLRATLTKHSRTHTDTRRYVCVTCGKRFLDKQTLDEHGVTHLQIKPFQCHICLKQLTRRSRLRMHLRAHEEELSPSLVLVCAVCARAFRDTQDAEEHAAKSKECVEQLSPAVKEENEAAIQLSPTSGLVTHTVAVFAKFPQADCGPEGEALLSTLTDFARIIIRVVEIEKAFRCEYCEDVFYLEDALNSHRVIHKGVKNPFTCHICKVSFATYSRCTTHKTTHGFYKRSLADCKKQAKCPGRPEAGPSATGILGYGGFPVVKHFLCEDCGRSYLHWTYLQVHRRMKHANDNYLYKCNQCELTFLNSWSLTYHRKKMHGKIEQEDGGAATKISRNDYRIPCRDCSEVLPNKNALYAHRQKEHSTMSDEQGSEDAGGVTQRVRGTSCCKCGHSFTEHSALQRHLKEVHGHESEVRTGRAHPCGVCGRVFRSASIRNEHLRVHTGERPYPCDVCGVAFRRSSAMRNHRLIHSGVRAWACGRCPKRFRIRSDLRTHLRLKHPTHLIVIEVGGLNPTPEEVKQHLRNNNITQDRIIDITKMSFEKGSSSILPTSARALSLLSGVPRTNITCDAPAQSNTDMFQPARRGRGIAKNPRRPKILQGSHDEGNLATNYPISIDASGEELSELNVQLLLRERALVNGNQMVQLQLEDDMLLE